MIDFQKSVLFKLDPIAVNHVHEPINKFLIEGEIVLSAFKTVRDQLVFTNKRIIAANVQGLIGKKLIILRFHTAKSKRSPWRLLVFLTVTAN